MADSDLPRIGAPATRALAAIGVHKLDQLPAHTAQQLLAQHGFGPRALRILDEALQERGLSLRTPEGADSIPTSDLAG